MRRRARLLAVLATLVAGVVGVIAATQTWVSVTLDDGAGQALEVPGSSALPVLTPLSLAVLALGAALSIVGVALRYVFAVLSAVIAVVLGWLAGTIAVAVPVTATASTVTAATGIAGLDGVADLIASASATPWPAVTAIAQLLLAAAAVLTLVTARSWRSGASRKYDAATPSGSPADASRPHDAIDSWDDLSRGDDPTR
ncbi:Trp biosynthesis-associated membrane protein [Microbacterium sp. NPDC091313]